MPNQPRALLDGGCHEQTLRNTPVTEPRRKSSLAGTVDSISAIAARFPGGEIDADPGKRIMAPVSATVEIYMAGRSLLSELQASLPDPSHWRNYGGELLHEGGDWQVLIREPEEVAPEEVPGSVRALQPYAHWQVSVALEPETAALEGWAFFERVLEAIRSATGGVSAES
jgi:hypothetical protein